LITANFDNLVAWKNGVNGAIASYVGDVRFNNFKTADNLSVGLEVSYLFLEDTSKIVDSVIICNSQVNNEDRLDTASPFGIVTPRTEGFAIEGTSFAGCDANESAALGDCS